MPAATRLLLLYIIRGRNTFGAVGTIRVLRQFADMPPAVVAAAVVIANH